MSGTEYQSLPNDPNIWMGKQAPGGGYTNTPPQTTISGTSAPGQGGSDGLFWGITIVVILVVVALIILIVWWATRNVTEDNDSALAITGVDFSSLSSTSITATWTAVGNKDDVVVLYVKETGKDQWRFDRNGTPLGVYKNSGKIFQPNNSATVVGLKPNTNYDAKLIVTNPNVTGHNASQSKSGINTATKVKIGGKFYIKANGQPGQISRDKDMNPTQVYYTNGGIDASTSLFRCDPDGFLCGTIPGEPLTENTPCGPNNFVLYSDGTTNTATLSTKRKSELTDEETENAKWEYNETGDNEWCIKGDGVSGLATRRCMRKSDLVLLNPEDENANDDTTRVLKYPIYVGTTSPTGWTNHSYI